MCKQMTLLSIGLWLATAASLQAGEVFDRYLNYPVVDAACREPIDIPHKKEGLVLAAYDKAPMTDLTSQKPLGQTFKTGSQADVLWRVCLGICHWPDEWTKEEAVTFTLYDSPAKKKELYSRTIPFEQKWHKWDICYDVHLPTRPGTEYYFEITHNGKGDNKIPVVYFKKDKYADGCAYVAGQPQKNRDLYFVTLVKPKRDREKNLRRFLDRFDYEQPMLKDAGKAYKKGDLEKACQLVLKAFEKHLAEGDFYWKLPDNFDPGKMKKLLETGKLWRKAKKHKGQDFIALNEQANWREIWPHTSDYIRRNDLFREIGWAYGKTGNEKYAQLLNDLMLDYMEDNNSPYDGGMRGGKWVAMFQAWRLNDAWSGFAAALDSESLTDDVKLAYFDYMDRMAHFAMTEPSGGNHLNAVAEALMRFATNWPLYAKSKEYFQFGFEQLCKNSKKLFLDDGACREPAYNYHGYSLSNLIVGMETANDYGLETPQEIQKIIEKALAYRLYVLQPDGQPVPYGDTDCADFRAGIKNKFKDGRQKDQMEYYRKFKRDDLIYIATDGRQGTRPRANSYAFPDIGHYIMRSDWGDNNGENFEQVRYLFMRTGSIGSHGHEDMNMISLYAYGQPLLIDPGRTTYGTPLMYELSRPWSHNVLLVDEQRMNHVRGEMQYWKTGSTMDYADCLYKELYKGVSHRRAVVFVRPDYWVMFDKADSQKGSKMGINFWMTPPDVTINQKEGFVHSNDPQGANILVKSLDSRRPKIKKRNGTLDLNKNKRDDIPVVSFWQPKTRHARFATLMYPFPKAAQEVPTKTIWRRGAYLCEIGKPDKRDYVFYAMRNPIHRQVNRGRLGSDIDFAAQVGLIRTTGGKVKSFALVDGSFVDYDNKPLARCDKRLPYLSVRYFADTVEVNCELPDKSLEIATLGRTRTIVNRRPRNISGEQFTPFDW